MTHVGSKQGGGIWQQEWTNAVLEQPPLRINYIRLFAVSSTCTYLGTETSYRVKWKQQRFSKTTNKKKGFWSQVILAMLQFQEYKHKNWQQSITFWKCWLLSQEWASLEGEWRWWPSFPNNTLTFPPGSRHSTSPAVLEMRGNRAGLPSITTLHTLA